jgi:hypothetical protein
MNIGLAFWVLMLIWLVFGIGWYFGALGAYGAWGNGVLLFFLLGLLGWHAFGPPLHG